MALSMKKVPGDLNFNESVARVQSETRGKALLSLAEPVKSYLHSEAK